jgi:toxin ParE1/3/4
MSAYRISPRAERDLEEIWLYTEGRWSAAQADRYAGALIDMIEALAADPGLGRKIDDVRPGYRKQAAGSHFIFYRQAPPGIEVIRILHQRMNVEAHLRD